MLFFPSHLLIITIATTTKKQKEQNHVLKIFFHEVLFFLNLKIRFKVNSKILVTLISSSLSAHKSVL